MRRRVRIAAFSALTAFAALANPAAAAPRSPTSGAASAKLEPEIVALPGAEHGAGFDDLGFAPGLRRVLAPGGGSGRLYLIDPDDKSVTSVGAFSEANFQGGHGEGTTSADEGRGVLFAIDRTSMKLDVIDPAPPKIVSSAPLASGPDYVRWVAPTSEAWVTQPDADRIEIFSVGSAAAVAPKSVATIEVKGGPESLVIDRTRNRAYSNLWEKATVAIDLKTRRIVATWTNGCKGSRGIALDEKRGFLFVGCKEGRAAVLDLNDKGKLVSSIHDGDGVDVIAYSPTLSHLYLPGAKSETMAILGVSQSGTLSLLGRVKTAKGAHCVAADDKGAAWVCDPAHGRLLRFADPYPASH